MVDSDGGNVAYNDDGGSGRNARLDFIYQRARIVDVLQRQHVHTLRAQAAMMVVNLFNGRTPSSLLRDAANALHNGYRADDYNLQNIAAGTRVRVNMTSSLTTIYGWLYDRLVAENDDSERA